MIIALFPNRQKRDSISLAVGIREFLEQHGALVVATESEATLIGAKPLSHIDPKKIDLIISMGGDGTILRLLHSEPHLNAPLLGINLGGLGFLADVPVVDVYPSLQDLLNGTYKVSKRIRMEATSPQGKSFFAVNDIVVHRANNPSLIDLAVYVDDVYLNTFSADGLIIATPSGSTAYSLAAGGPILAPDLQAVVITPICPHTISNRPIVLMPKKEIRVEYLSEYEPVEISYDGISDYLMRTGESCRLTPSSTHFQLVCLNRNDYFATLRTKLGWTGKLRSS